MKTLSKVMVAMLAILILAPMNAEASKKEKKKKEKKKYEWVMPELSGNADFDLYLLTCDTVWNDVQKVAESMNTYTFKTDTLRDVNGADYVMAHMEDASGAYLTRGAVTWQLVNAIMQGTNIVLDIANIGVLTASATTALPDMGLQALSYGKYLKSGPKVIELCGAEIKQITAVRRQQYQQWKAMKEGAIDPATLGIWNEEQLKSLSKCCFITKLDKSVGRELTPEEVAAQEALMGGLNIAVAPEVEGETLDAEPEDLDALMEAEGA